MATWHGWLVIIGIVVVVFWLLSTDGIDVACRYVASLHDEPASADG